jgi:hypothetical protein
MRTRAFLLAISLVLAVAGTGLAGPLTDKSILIDDSQGNLHKVNVLSGDSNLIGSTNLGSSLFDIAFDSSANLFGITGTSLYGLDHTNGAASIIGAHNIGDTSAYSLDFSSANVLYVAVRGNESLYTLNTATGAATLVGHIGFPVNGDLAFDDSDNLFMSGNDEKLYSINTTTGAGALVGPINFPQIAGMDFIGGMLIGISRTTDQIISIDTATGAGTLISSLTNSNISTYGATAPWSGGTAGQQGGNNPIPEPATLALLGLGVLGIAWRRRRKHR